jgi:predicted RNA-binding protein Jag
MNVDVAHYRERLKVRLQSITETAKSRVEREQ